jgi:hypothetical protein
MKKTHAQRNEQARIRTVAYFHVAAHAAAQSARQKARRAADPEGERAKGRARQNRRAGKIAHMMRNAIARQLEQISEYEQRGFSVVNARQLARPFLVFELRGVRKFEPWPSAGEVS